MKRHVFYLLVILLSLSALAISQSRISFIEEYIDFNLDSNFFSINGIYTFKNNTGIYIDQRIAYPFTVESSKIDSIRVFNLNASKEIYYKRTGKSILFNIQLQPFDTLEINIFYRQPAAKINTYILTSTKYWKEALKKANYSLTTGKKLKIRSFSYQPDSIKIHDNTRSYLWFMHEFMPQKDFEVIIDK